MVNLRWVAKCLALVGLASSLASTGAMAQGPEAVITGRVTNDKGNILDYANVSAPQFNKAVTVNTKGVYRLVVPANGQTVSIVARALGRSPVTQEIVLTPGAHTLDFQLSSTIRLTEVVVTGVAQATNQKNLTIGVARINAEAMSQVVGTSPIAALAGKVAGARIGMPRGTPGANPVIRLRGSTNLGIGGSQPLLVVDGVITQGSLQDIDANDIESIEVLKGAASSATYGSTAANGVLNITTKRGKNIANNKVAFSVRSEMGSGSQERFVPLNQHHNFQLNADGSFVLSSGLRVPQASGLSDQPYPTGTWRNQQQAWMRNGAYQNSSMTMAVRRAGTNISSTLSYEANDGILPFLIGERRRNVGLNVDQQITSKIDVSLSARYANNTNDQDPGGSGPFFALLQAPPDIDLRHPWGAADSVLFNPYLPPAVSPSARGNPLYDLTVRQQKFQRERVIGSGVIRYRPFTWLSFDATYGTDRLNSNSTNYLPRGTFSTDAANTLRNGTYSNGFGRSQNSNTTVNGTLSRQWGNFRSSTRLTYLQELTTSYSTGASTSKLNIDLPTLNGGDPTQTSSSSSQQDIRAQNYFITQQADYKDKYLLQVMGRRDGSSLFGANERWKEFYGASVAYRITEDFKIPGVQELKVRLAKGTAGLRPSFTGQFQTYSLSGGAVSKSQVGNPDLKPAISTENEGSVNAEFLDRFSAEFTLSRRSTAGAFLSVPLSSAKSGGFTSQYRNAADISSRTLEGQLTGRLIDRAKLQYTATITFDRTRQNVDRLDRPAFNQAEAFGQSQGQQFWVRQGEALGMMYGDRWVRNPQELLDNPVNKANPLFTIDNYVVNPLGYVVLKTQRGTAAETPIKYVNPDGTTLSKMGDANPKFNWGLSQDLTWHDFSVHMLVDGTVGGNIYNFTKQWMFQDLRHGDQDATNYPVADRVAIGFFSSGFYNGNAPSSYFVENGTYAKLRELSVSYTLPTSLMQTTGMNVLAQQVKVALIGRNLKTWTKYTGADPETLGGDDFNYRIDGFRYPSLRQISAQISITY
jgi:TonB-linked SusC/RagA family outer membrane protein